MHDEYLIPLKGQSMTPLLKEGDELIVEINQDPNLKPYQRGNILVFKDEGYFTAHRLLKKTDHHLLLKGDKSYNIDRISPKTVVGRVIGYKNTQGVYKWPDGKHLGQSLATSLSEYSLLYSKEKASRFHPLRLACLALFRSLLWITRYFIASSKT